MPTTGFTVISWAPFQKDVKAFTAPLRSSLWRRLGLPPHGVSEKTVP